MEDFIHMKAYNLPYDLLIETIGNLYVADWSNTMRNKVSGAFITVSQQTACMR